MRVLVAGASSGVGRAAAQAAAPVASKLVMMARRPERLQEASQGLNAETIIGDVTRTEDCEAAVQLAAGSGPLIVVNSAGLAAFGDFHEATASEWSRQIQVNLVGTMNLCHAAIPRMLLEGQGRIINVLSIAAVTAFPGAAAYCASKAGGLALGRALNAEYRSRGVHVVSLILGSVDTPLWDDKSFVPNKQDMLTPEAVAEEIVGLATMAFDRSIDEVTLMPPKGIL